MTSCAALCHLLSCLICVTTIYAAGAAGASSKSARLVHRVCKSASSYTFCVGALYSDPATKDASSLEQLADISVRLAYKNATSTQSHIHKLLKNASRRGKQLLRCRDDYAKAVKAIEVAANDVNSEDFSELPDLASKATRAADDCNAALRGNPSSPGLKNSNQNLKGLCEIFANVARLLTSGYPPA